MQVLQRIRRRNLLRDLGVAGFARCKDEVVRDDARAVPFRLELARLLVGAGVEDGGHVRDCREAGSVREVGWKGGGGEERTVIAVVALRHLEELPDRVKLERGRGDVGVE